MRKRGGERWKEIIKAMDEILRELCETPGGKMHLKEQRDLKKKKSFLFSHFLKPQIPVTEDFLDFNKFLIVYF